MIPPPSPKAPGTGHHHRWMQLQMLTFLREVGCSQLGECKGGAHFLGKQNDGWAQDQLGECFTMGCGYFTMGCQIPICGGGGEM